MLYELRLAKINSNMTSAVIECLYATAGSPMKIGDKLFDLSVDLGSGFSQYCPPISYFRVIMRETAWLRKTPHVPGDTCDVGELLAVFSKDQDSPDDDGSSARPLRIATAGIALHSGMWSANNR